MNALSDSPTTDPTRYEAERAPIDFEIIAVNLQRMQIKRLLHDRERLQPGRSDHDILQVMMNVVPWHLLGRNSYPFSTLRASGCADPAGDRAFDEPFESDPQTAGPASTGTPIASHRAE